MCIERSHIYGNKQLDRQSNEQCGVVGLYFNKVLSEWARWLREWITIMPNF